MLNVPSSDRLYAHRFGEPSKPWVIFFAGWGSEVSDYEQQLRNLSQDFYIVAFSLPGFGEQDPLVRQSQTVKGHAAFFTNYLLNDFGLDSPVVLMGHSTGAGVAALVASQLQSRAQHLVLISPIGSPDPIFRSGPRLLRHVNWRKARRWLRGSYRRRFVSNVKLGIDAKQLDLTADILRLNEQGTPIKIFLAKNDHVAPAGKFSEMLDVKHLSWIDGGHAWFRHDAAIVHEYLLSLDLDAPELEAVHPRSWYRVVKDWILDMLGTIERALVPSTPIIIETVMKADSDIQENVEKSYEG